MFTVREDNKNIGTKIDCKFITEPKRLFCFGLSLHCEKPPSLENDTPYTNMKSRMVKAVGTRIASRASRSR
jgi:hypothetical protein